MKSKLIILFVVGCAWAGIAQDDSSASTNAPATSAAPATTPTADTPPIATSTAKPEPNTLIPLVQFVDVPLTAAIENLARQANLNYILDPRLNYGQPGPDGKIMAQPNISIRWENLTAEQALYALLNNYDLVLVEDPKTKIARISPKDPAAPDPLVTKVIQLKYASPSNIVTSVQSGLSDKRSRVVTDVRTSQLVVVATEKELVAVEEMIMRLDTPTKQVLIEARLLETSRRPSSVKGVDWSGTLKAQQVRFGNNVDAGEGGRYSHTVTYPTNAVFGGFDILHSYGPNNLINNPNLLWDTAKGFNPATAFLDADGLSAVLSFLNADSDTRILSTPRTITLDNVPATLSVTRTYPIINVSAGTANTAGGSSITYSNLGTILNVTPRISANDCIELKVSPEVSSRAGTETKVAGNLKFDVDLFDLRRFETQVLIPSGNTLVIGGLMSDETGKDYTKVPILGDVPLLGMAFRHESKSQNQRNLIVFITPTIVKDSDFQPTSTDFLKNPVPTDTQTHIKIWDSGKPLDWTKPFRRQTD
jgi:type IV pilus assembly protein PilQ